MGYFQRVKSADLSQSPGLDEWFGKFRAESRLSNSDIIREALDYYRASTGPQLIMLKADVARLSSRVMLLEHKGKSK